MTAPVDHLLTALTGPNARDGERCLTIAGRPVSSHELLARAGRLAAALSGLPAVAVHAKPTLSTAISATAAILAGVPLVPLPADSGPAELDYLVTDSGAALVLVGDDALPPGCTFDAPVVRADTLAGQPLDQAPSTPADPALVMYTSGTTGRPKGVVISRGAIAACLDALAEVWAWTSDDTLVHGLPLFHVHGLVLGLFGPLRHGSPLVHTTSPTPAAYAAAQGSLYFGVPTVWSRVARDPLSARALRSARLLVSGSAPLPVPVFEALTSLTGQRPIERYGMTETLITLSTRSDGERRPGWVGLPIPGVQARVVDDAGRAVQPDAQTLGSLQIRGATLFDGYLNRPADTAAVLGSDGWLTTGDVALTDADGFVRIVGRASTDLIKSGGYRIGAGEVEDALLAHPGVREAAVLGLPHPDLGEQVVAFVCADGVGADELSTFVAGRLSSHKRPRVIYFLDALPRNAMGKVVKSELGVSVAASAANH